MEELMTDPLLESLARLVGHWTLEGDTQGTVTYRVLTGGHFLVQEFDLVLFGESIRGVEVIGRLRPFGEKPGEELQSRAYDNSGNTFDYVYELEGDELTIWGGKKGSESFFRGRFSPDGNKNVGHWVYPGGGYQSTMTRVLPQEKLS